MIFYFAKLINRMVSVGMAALFVPFFYMPGKAAEKVFLRFNFNYNF